MWQCVCLCNTTSIMYMYMGSSQTQCVPDCYLSWPPKLEQSCPMKAVITPEGPGTATKLLQRFIHFGMISR